MASLSHVFPRDRWREATANPETQIVLAEDDEGPVALACFVPERLDGLTRTVPLPPYPLDAGYSLDP